jgi:hypothetical protein
MSCGRQALPGPPSPEAGAPPVTEKEARRYTGTYTHQDLVRYAVTWDGRQLVLMTDAARPLTRARGETIRTSEGEELTFVFKPGEEKACYLHMDLLSAIRTRD